MTNSKITIIIPTINRPTLQKSLDSLLKQICPEWLAIVAFDGVDIPEGLPKDDRIQYLKTQKLGIGKNSAGRVRNQAIKFAQTEWCGFLDDDDILLPNYISSFYEYEKEDKYDVILFRMALNGRSVPTPNGKDIFHVGNVGISFALKRELLINFPFVPSHIEDFELLNKLRENKRKILVSKKLCYVVRNSTIPTFQCQDIIVN